MENKMETTIVYWGLYGDNGKENGNHYSIFYSVFKLYSIGRYRLSEADNC